MSISLKTRKMLWGRSANRCSMPDCRKILVEDESDTDDPSIIGEEAHIIAKEIEGPRGDNELPLENRDFYSNLILMCNIHHKVIDDQPNKYTVQVLNQMKEAHVKWVDSNLDIDKMKINDDELYATYIDEWCKCIDINNWKQWSTGVLFAGQPEISRALFSSLKKLNEYLLNRVWPHRYQQLEKALSEFRFILSTFIDVFNKYLEPKDSFDPSIMRTERFYKINEWNEERYNLLSKKYEYHVDLVEDLMFELTRSANRICDNVRACILSSFRLKEGVLLVTEGPLSDFSYQTKRLEYHNDGEHFTGLRNFMEIRTSRDSFYGEGLSEDYFSQI